ncbi:MAG: aminotransferase class I/II-fold pyridoxal phosphate-dependent enzyme [Ruminobacter sp.]|nr:aminotransferase class I/II-fold pyridoxal phosphate-dependent enzyme [Ruminobacter sp.]
MFKTPKFTNMLNSIIKEKSSENLSGNADDELSVQNNQINVSSRFTSFSEHPQLLKLRTMQSLASTFNVGDPFFKEHDFVTGTVTHINGREYINYSSYNYLGMNGSAEVNDAVIEAIKKHGTSVGASRLVAGERPFQRDLEKKLAEIYETDDAIVFVSGHATNVNVISTLFGPKDLIIYDALVHNSIIEGIKLSGAPHFPYLHNDPASLENLLVKNRRNYERVLIVTEGLFSMDGDIPDLPKLIDLKKRYSCFLMIDEAHSLGVLGNTGKGIYEHYNVNPHDVDLWMGTLSKTLASCGGYIAANRDIVDILKYNAPGFVFSVGLSAPMATAALTSLNIMLREPERVARLRNNARLFLDTARKMNINTGRSQGYSVVAVITGSSRKAVSLSSALFNQGINVQPIIHPAVEEQQARLRFFITSEHTEDQILKTCEAVASLLA